MTILLPFFEGTLSSPELTKNITNQYSDVTLLPLRGLKYVTKNKCCSFITQSNLSFLHAFLHSFLFRLIVCKWRRGNIIICTTDLFSYWARCSTIIRTSKHERLQCFDNADEFSPYYHCNLRNKNCLTDRNRVFIFASSTYFETVNLVLIIAYEPTLQ